SGNVQTNWAGTWHGTPEAYPGGELGHGWNMTMKIGPYSMTDNQAS
ncbi:unnamed protein product, partial [Rotaria sp. Silwood1]